MTLKQYFTGRADIKLLMIALIAILLMSIVPVLIKWISANEVTIGIVRLAVATIGIGLILLFKRSSILINRVQFCWLLALGLVFATHWYLYFLSIKLTDASLAAIGVSTFGIHLLLLSVIIKKEKFSKIDFSAVLLCIIGIVITAPSFELEKQKWLGFAISVASGFLYACLPLINRQVSGVRTQVRAFAQFGFALIFFLMFLPFADFNMQPQDWQGLLVLGILSTLIAHTLWIKASTELPANLTAVVYYGYVPISLILSYILLNEEITLTKIVGAGLIIVANILTIFFHQTAKPK
jgi:drug/metabolite transporter (DMT)-like permease